MPTTTPDLRLADACARLDLSDRTVRKLITEGRLTAYMIGGAYRFYPADLDAYIASTKIEAS